MYLEEFYDYKNRLMEDLLTNEEIVRLLDPDTPVDQAASLVYKQVFPYEYLPETVEYGRTFICSDVDITSVENHTVYTARLYVWVFTHRSLLRLPEGGVRVDKLCSEVAKVLDGSHYYGFGALDLASVKRFAPMTDYQGKVLAFEAKDWHRTNPTGKEWPVNRKRG